MLTRGDAVARVVSEHDGNWLESRMSRLGGQFAGIVHVELPAEHEAALIRALRGLDSQGLSVVVHTEAAAPEAGGPVTLLELVGQDQPGIVRQISEALARFRVNVEELETERSSAAMSGELLFKARARLSVPPGCDLAELRATLEKIAADLIVDISLASESESAKPLKK